MKFAGPLAQGVSRPSINHLHLIHKSTNRYFIFLYLIYQVYPARARAPLGAPGAKVGERTVAPMVVNLLWAPFGDSFGLIFGLSGDLGAPR